MKRNDIVIGIIILAVLAGVIYFVRRPKQKVEELPGPTTEEKIENSFNLEIPEDVDKAELKDMSGGNASGIVTRKFESGRFTLTVLADLPDLTSGVYSVKISNDKGAASVGQMRIAKGGYLLDYSSGVNYSSYNKVTISVGDKVVLEGSF
ncbi:hypothetical protein A2975_00930 [Candidatus Woesebacteria bacterium RIFCSPLOWO2_01_FULL_44_14]|uniref:Uncharacterized protein n=1 Tax=Candidatus Woesebacteria bacterium RIFCSPLOWO2_01_FULL_44_14 TaxID=1802525 RepID=A0A1F8C1F9_9BACT|nr:MAG: hypothetical protein A2975_00930 [Candidatus Woesebacteria bacterium RIFCSPLOWO2_01_FULL_44_14]